MKIEFSSDDGSLYDIQFANLLMKYNLKGIFYIPNNCELDQRQIKWLSDNGHKIGGHTVNHPVLRELSPELQYWEIKENKNYLEGIIYDHIYTFAYPKGKYDEVTIEQVKRAGYNEARTTDVFKLDENPFRQGTAVHIYPNRKEYTKNWLEHSKEMYDLSLKEDKKFRVWGHGWEIEKFNLWEEFEELLKYVSK